MTELSPVDHPSNSDSKVNIINAVKTPLGFFVLVVLIVEVIMGITASFSTGSDKTYLITGMIALIFLLVIIVSGIAIFRPMALYGLPTTPSESSSDSAVFTDLMQKVPDAVKQHIEFLEQCHKKEMETLSQQIEMLEQHHDQQIKIIKQQHSRQTKALKKQIKGLEEENNSLGEWLKIYMPGAREPEDL